MSSEVTEKNVKPTRNKPKQSYLTQFIIIFSYIIFYIFYSYVLRIVQNEAETKFKPDPLIRIAKYK